MKRTRYKEERTLVRKIQCIPGEDKNEFKRDKNEFKRKVLLLRRHFEQFNRDVSDLCQWLMGVRPDGKYGSEQTSAFWELILNPEFEDTDEKTTDKYRRMIFDVAAGFAKEATPSGVPITPEQMESIKYVATLKRTQSAEKLFSKLRDNETQRMILVKSATEWIYARYKKAFESWEDRMRVWKFNKEKFESENPELTEKIRESFNEIFSELGIVENRARLCGWIRLKELRNNCGSRDDMETHENLCQKYLELTESESWKNNPNSKFFLKNVRNYLEIFAHKPHGSAEQAMKSFCEKYKNASGFVKFWHFYLDQMGINENSIVENNYCLPHCFKNEIAEKKNCKNKKHTEKCEKYRNYLLPRKDLQDVEGEYREWRRRFFKEPEGPSFCYPSAKNHPTSKIFGAGYHDVDWDNSKIKLRLDDMGKDEFLEFGFLPWPEDYTPQPKENRDIVTSVHVSFVGTRPRVGFRFSVPHNKGRFNITQDEIDELRKGMHLDNRPESEFVSAVREKLRKAYNGDWEKSIRILAIDLGTGGSGAALYQGGEFVDSELLKVIKRKKYELETRREKDESDEKKQKGLSLEHYGRHLKVFSERASEIAKNKPVGNQELSSHDLRSSSIHMRSMIKDWVRLNTHQIIDTAEKNEVNLIVFESLRGQKAPGYDEVDIHRKKEKARMAFWSYGKIRFKVTEKAVERGMLVVTVPEFKSSQRCGVCGKLHDKPKKCIEEKLLKRTFSCSDPACSNKGIDSEKNAALVLARMFLGEIEMVAEPVDKIRKRK